MTKQEHQLARDLVSYIAKELSRPPHNPAGGQQTDLATRCSCSDANALAPAGDNYTKTEANQSATLPAEGKAGEPPEGPGRDGNKPLMRNRAANEVPSPIGNAAGNTFQKLTAAEHAAFPKGRW